MDIELKRGFIFKKHGNNIIVIDHIRQNLILNFDLFDLYPISIINLIEKHFLSHYNLILLHSKEINKIRINKYKKYLEKLENEREKEEKILIELANPPYNYNYLWNEFNISFRQNKPFNIGVIKFVFEKEKGFQLLSYNGRSFSKIFKENCIYQKGFDLKKYLLDKLSVHDKEYLRENEFKIKEV